MENNLKLVAIVKYRQGGVLVYAFYEMLGSMWGSRKTVLKTIPYYDFKICLLYTSPSPRDRTRSRMPSSA